MKQFNYPTTILYGDGAIEEMATRISALKLKKPLVVTDQMLVKLGIVDAVTAELKEKGLAPTIFADTHPNPIEEDVEKGSAAYKANKCDCVVAVGGGSPMDVAKVVMVAVTHSGPLEQYDDTKGGDQRITNELPLLFAVPTTAGTGSEVGRSGVIILRSTHEKTIIFHPKLMPTIAALEPQLTKDLPPPLTAATGIDAFTHCLEAFLAPGFHPLADGIAIEGLRLVLKNLPLVVKEGSNLEARGQMQLAASMGATAFQKGLGMIHSMAHPLSSECHLHHGLANALVLPKSIDFLEHCTLNPEQKYRLQRVLNIFSEFGLAKETLSSSCEIFFKSLGIQFGLKKHGVKKEQLALLASKALKDPCHQSNMVPVTEKDFLHTLEGAFA